MKEPHPEQRVAPRTNDVKKPKEAPTPKAVEARAPRLRLKTRRNQEKIQQLQQELGQVDQLGRSLQTLNPQDEVLGPIVRIKRALWARQQVETLGQLAQLREENITDSHHATRRAYKELPHFFKFCLFKTKPKRTLVTDKNGEYIRPEVQQLNFRGMEVEVTYFEGELGDNDRMLFLALQNEAIRHKEYLRAFGQIPFTIDEIADKADFGACNRERVEEGLRRLMRTEVFIKKGAGTAHFRDRFHLLERYTVMERSDLQTKIDEKLLALEQANDVVPQPVEVLRGQAQALLGKFKPRTPKLMLITFNRVMTEALLGDQITTVDMWALQQLHGNPARTLFLFLYDISQWRKSQDPLDLPIQDLLTLMDLTTTTDLKNGKEYPQWNRTRQRVEEIVTEINQVSKFIRELEWLGEGEESVLRLQLSDAAIQILPR